MAQSRRPRVQRASKSESAPARSEGTSGARAARPAGAKRVRRPSSDGPPVGLLILGVVGLVGLLGWAFMSGTNDAVDAGSSIESARRALGEGMSAHEVELRLGRALSDPSISSAELAEVRAVREELAERDAELELMSQNLVGTKYLQTKIQNYADRYLTDGTPEQAKVRVFLERCAYFKKRWPQHDELDWIDRMEDRFEGYVKLSDPPTWADVAWKVECLTKPKPREYAEAFAAVDAYLARTPADAPERILATNLRKTMLEERVLYHEDRMQQAKFEYERNDDAMKACEWLAMDIVHIGDAAMEDEAVGYFLALPNVDGYLRGYKRNRPLVYEGLVANERIRAYAESQDI